MACTILDVTKQSNWLLMGDLFLQHTRVSWLRRQIPGFTRHFRLVRGTFLFATREITGDEMR